MSPIPFADKVLEQADVMRDQVAHHLERARIAARVTIIGTVTEVAPAIEALRRTMEKIHRGRSIVIEVEADAQTRFRGERQGPRGDGRQPRRQRLQMGGLAGVHRGPAGAAGRPGAGPILRIVVDDDGRGLSAGPTRAGLAPRPAAGRVQARLRARTVDRGRPGGALWRQPVARQRPRSAACGPNWCCRGFEDYGSKTAKKPLFQPFPVPKRLLNAGTFMMTRGRAVPSVRY